MYCPLCWETPIKLPIVELPLQKPTVIEWEILICCKQ